MLLFNSLSELQTKPLPPIRHICDFSRGGLNVRLRARIQTLLRGHKYDLFIFQRADLGWIWGIKSKEGGFEEEMEGDRWFSSV